MDNATIKKDSIASTLLTNQTLNLFGIGSALIGLQARHLMHTLARSLWVHCTCQAIMPCSLDAADCTDELRTMW